MEVLPINPLFSATLAQVALHQKDITRQRNMNDSALRLEGSQIRLRHDFLLLSEEQSTTDYDVLAQCLDYETNLPSRAMSGLGSIAFYHCRRIARGSTEDHDLLRQRMEDMFRVKVQAKLWAKENSEWNTKKVREYYGLDADVESVKGVATLQLKVCTSFTFL
jgi:hypothetical protein